MKTIKQYFNQRRVRRLAERLLATQPLFGEYVNQADMCEKAITTSQVFYERWERRKRFK